MARAAKLLSVLCAAVWLMLLAQVGMRFVAGWWREDWLLFIALLPAVGLAVSLITYRLAAGRPRPALFAAAFMAALAGLYVYGMQSGVADFGGVPQGLTVSANPNR